MTLDKLKLAQLARIYALPNNLALSTLLLEQGFIPNTLVQLVHKAPLGGPLAFKLHGAKVSVDKQTAAHIQIEVI